MLTVCSLYQKLPAPNCTSFSWSVWKIVPSLSTMYWTLTPRFGSWKTLSASWAVPSTSWITTCRIAKSAGRLAPL